MYIQIATVLQCPGAHQPRAQQEVPAALVQPRCAARDLSKTKQVLLGQPAGQETRFYPSTLLL